jgi:uncharacterized LabA/DUF88 family protein
MYAGNTERIALFIDGANLFASTKALNLRIDFNSFHKFFQKRGTYLITANYYTAVYTDAEGNKPLMDLLTWLAYNNYTVVQKPAKEFSKPDSRQIIIKGNMDIDLAVDALMLSDYYDRAIIVTGDGDFERLVRGLQSKGKRVTVVSTMKSSPPMIANELRKAANEFVDLDEIREHITDKRERSTLSGVRST